MFKRSHVVYLIAVVLLSVIFVTGSAADAAISNPPYVSGSGSAGSFGGGPPTRFVLVIYSDDVAVDVSTLGTGDIRVTGPNGYSVLAPFVSVDDPTNGSPRTARYLLPPPGGTWDAADNGNYDKFVEPNEVADTEGLFVAAALIGTTIITEPASGCFANVNNLNDGSFESTNVDGVNPYWTVTSNSSGSPFCLANRCGSDDQPHSGAGWVRFGNASAGTNGETTVVSQTVSVPPGSDFAKLTFRYRAAAVGGPATSRLAVFVNGTMAWSRDEPATPDAAYLLQQVDLTPFLNSAPFTLSFAFNRPAGSSASDVFLLDTVGLLTTCPRPTITISGRVFTPSGAPLRSAVVTMTDLDGNRRTATTGSFGTYEFASVIAARPATLSVSSKRYRFATRSVFTPVDQTGVDFIGLE